MFLNQLGFFLIFGNTPLITQNITRKTTWQQKIKTVHTNLVPPPKKRTWKLTWRSKTSSFCLQALSFYSSKVVRLNQAIAALVWQHAGSILHVLLVPQPVIQAACKTIEAPAWQQYNRERKQAQITGGRIQTTTEAEPLWRTTRAGQMDRWTEGKGKPVGHLQTVQH